MEDKMNTTKHLMDRMNQRGIHGNMVKLALDHGKMIKDKIILDKKQTQKLIDDIDMWRKDLLKILDKNGLVVIVSNNTIITTYNRSA